MGGLALSLLLLFLPCIVVDPLTKDLVIFMFSYYYNARTISSRFETPALRIARDRDPDAAPEQCVSVGSNQSALRHAAPRRATPRGF